MTHTRMLITPLLMSDQSDRLSAAIKETRLSMAEMSRRWGWNYDTLKSNANGNMAFSFKKAQVYAGRLKVRAEWLYAGTPPMREAAKPSKREPIEVPLIGWVQAGALTDIGPIDEVHDAERLLVDDLPPGNWFATDVHGDSMDRVSPEGSRIFVNADDRTPKPGRFYLFSLRGETTFKRFYDDPVQRLEPYSTNPNHRPIYTTADPDWNVIGRVFRSVIDLE